MNSTRTLPPEYQQSGRFDLHGLLKMILLNLAGLGLLILSGWAFTALLVLLRPAETERGLSLTLDGIGTAVFWLALLIGITAVMLVLHEGLHGLFFWRYTRTRPLFAFRGYYAYAAAPGWYIPRRQYLVTCLAPFVGISLLSALLFAVVPPGWFMPVLLLAVFNASGAVGDLWVAVMLLRRPPSCYALDLGDAVEFYDLQKIQP